MSNDYRYSDPCKEDQDYSPCDSFDHCCDKEESDDLWSWLPILIIVFLLCGGLGWFGGGGGGRGDSCGHGGGEGGMGWLLIVIIIILLFNTGDGKKGGFLGGLFG